MVLGRKKPLLLDQVKKQGITDIKKIEEFVNQYEDLSIEDFVGYLPDYIISQYKDNCRDPKERELWSKIQDAPRDTPQNIQNAQRLVMEYLGKFQSGPKYNEADNLKNTLDAEFVRLKQKEEEDERKRREQGDWDALDKNNYNALLSYKAKYPQSVHLDELDDSMWNCTKMVISGPSLGRYLSDWPLGRHAIEANQALSGISEWEETKRSGELLKVKYFLDTHPTSPFLTDIQSTYYRLRDAELQNMKENPDEYKKKDVILDFINMGIFSAYELIDEGLATDKSWETLMNLDRSDFEDLKKFQTANPDVQSLADSTDIFFFGTPGTGKTCLLMGLTGANGRGYTLNTKAQGGPYAAALQEYVLAGITPGTTFGSFVTTINGQITEEGKRGKTINHKINLVEMSGEEFAFRIADNDDVSLADMGTGATNLLRNPNHKVFFIIVDASKDNIKFQYVEDVKDAEGNIVDQRVRKKYISQLTILNKFVSLFELPENQDIMRKVDAIHFVVTKADILGDTKEKRNERAQEILQEKYIGPIEQLKNYCRQTKRINASTNYKPKLFTFSLGKFYLGDVFDFNSEDTLEIIDTIKHLTVGKGERGFWDKVKNVLN